MTPQLVLASTSRYREELLLRLSIPFQARAPQADEEKEKSKVAGMAPRPLAEHLAEVKARSLAGPGLLVLGGDQLVAFDGRILGKPGTKERAIEQLVSMAGHSHDLVTAICLVKPDGSILRHTDVTRIRFKALTRAQIEKVVELDNPIDCAGSYKIERHGISLVAELRTEDFTAIQGLPLIALSKMLKECGIQSP